MKYRKPHKPHMRVAIRPYSGYTHDGKKWYWALKAKKHWWNIWLYAEAPFETSGFEATNTEAVEAGKKAMKAFSEWQESHTYVSQVTERDL